MSATSHRDLAPGTSLLCHRQPAMIDANLAAMDLTQELPHLLRRAHVAAEAHFHAMFADNNTTARQAAVLLTVMQRPEISQKELGERLSIDPNTLSAIIVKLLARRLISRRRGATDRRFYGLFIAPAGIEILRRILPRIAEYQSRLADRLSHAERRQLVVLLQRLLGLAAAS